MFNHAAGRRCSASVRLGSSVPTPFFESTYYYHRLLGDFNEWTHGLVTRTLSAEFHLTDLRNHIRRTRGYPAILPLLNLDHIYFDHQLKIRKADFHRNRLSLIASDHLPLIADVVIGSDER